MLNGITNTVDEEVDDGRREGFADESGEVGRANG
jgi:hypothetical protein